jgi:DNA-binding CsgD family transcriptional regulator/tetratricopeptide (TPR) repeat protein
MDDWMVEWLARAADPLVGQAPGVAVELLTRAVASSPSDSPRHGLLASRLADALYRTGDCARAERVANHALEHATEPGLLVDLHWTLAQCRMREGSAEESLAMLAQALARPGISARHRARLLVLVARTHDGRGEIEKARQVATDALAVASEAGDTWAAGWALHVLILVTGMEGRPGAALSMFDRALAVTEADPALADLRLLLQINQAIALCNLDQHEKALTAAGRARDLADQIGTVVRLSQAHSALSQLLFLTGRWDDALAEAQIMHPDLSEAGVACGNFGITAVIRFHRGETAAARRHLAAAAPYARRLGSRCIAPLTLAWSLDRELDGALPEALAVLTDAIADSTEFEEIEDLFADAVRLAIGTGNLDTARTVADQAAALAEPEIPHRQANALYCGGLVGHDTSRLLAAAERYAAASRPLQRAKALEAAATEFVAGAELGQARAAFTGAVEVYLGLGAAADVARLQAEFRVHGIRRGPHVKHRRARSGWGSLTPTEIRVAAFVEEGLSNPEIAARLLLSPRTVATHVSHILKKLGVQSRIDIARESVLRTIAPR